MRKREFLYQFFLEFQILYQSCLKIQAFIKEKISKKSNQIGAIGLLLSQEQQTEPEISNRICIKSHRGQVTVEYILLAVALIALFHIVAGAFKNNDYLKNFQKFPGQIFQNLVENGNWEIDTDRSRENHPTQHERHYTPVGKGPK